MAFDSEELDLTDAELAEMGLGNEETEKLQYLQDQLGWFLAFFLTAFSFGFHYANYRASSFLYWAIIYGAFAWNNRRKRRTFYRLRNASETALIKCGKMVSQYKADSVAFVRENALVQLPSIKFTRHAQEAYNIFLEGDSVDFLEYPTFESIKAQESIKDDEPPADAAAPVAEVPSVPPRDGDPSQISIPVFTPPTS